MKPFFALLLLTCCGCTKLNNRYAVVCEYPNYLSKIAWLVVTDDAGSILKIFDLPAKSAQLVEEFDYESKDASTTYNLHLVYKGDSLYPYSGIISWYGVRNGASVSFEPGRYRRLMTYPDHFLFLNGTEMPDSVIVPGAYFSCYYADQQTIAIRIHAYSGQANLLVRVRAHSHEPFRSLYLPVAGLMQDSTFVQWSDFVSEDRFVPVEPPPGPQADDLEVSAVDPDFKQFTHLLSYEYAHQGTQSERYQVPLPPDLNPQARYRVRMRQGDFITEKIFQPREALHLEAPQIAIQAALFSSFQALQIATSGQPDLVSIYWQTQGPDLFKQWQIQGPPEAFEQMRLPDLSALSVLLPEIHMLDTASVAWQVSAYKYDHLNYEQLLAGFPFKGTDGRVFPEARYGLQMITKNY